MRQVECVVAVGAGIGTVPSAALAYLPQTTTLPPRQAGTAAATARAAEGALPCSRFPRVLAQHLDDQAEVGGQVRLALGAGVAD
jgi:hypothetical protein